MKKMASIILAFAMVLWVGAAYAGDLRLPQEMQSQFEQEMGAKVNYVIWFPVAPQLKSPGWQNILIISNFYSNPIQIGCWFTSFGRTQTLKTYELLKFEKRILYLDEELGIKDDIYDVFCGSDNLFGAALLFLEGGNIVTAWPPVVFF